MNMESIEVGLDLQAVVSNHWTGLLDWTTGLTFNHKISFSCTVMTTKIYCYMWTPLGDQASGLIMPMHRFRKWILDWGGGCTAKMCLG